MMDDGLPIAEVTTAAQASEGLGDKQRAAGPPSSVPTASSHRLRFSKATVAVGRAQYQYDHAQSFLRSPTALVPLQAVRAPVWSARKAGCIWGSREHVYTPACKSQASFLPRLLMDGLVSYRLKSAPPQGSHCRCSGRQPQRGEGDPTPASGLRGRCGNCSPSTMWLCRWPLRVGRSRRTLGRKPPQLICRQLAQEAGQASAELDSDPPESARTSEVRRSRTSSLARAASVATTLSSPPADTAQTRPYQAMSHQQHVHRHDRHAMMAPWKRPVAACAGRRGATAAKLSG